MQALWLYLSYEYKNAELKEKTIEAANETINKLQKEEDFDVILNNIDSLLINDSLVNNNIKSDIQIIVSGAKNKIKPLHYTKTTTESEKYKVTVFDTVLTKSIIKTVNNKRETIVKSEIIDPRRIEKKAIGLQHLFKKMAFMSIDKPKNINERLNFKHLKELLQKELNLRGISIVPIVKVVPKQFSLLKSSSLKNNIYSSLSLFPDDLTGNNYFLQLHYLSTSNFLIKQMASLIALSFILTLLVCFIIIYIFRKMLSQEKLHQLKIDFINNMTHELKTPIATISLAVESISNPIIKNNTKKFDEYTNIIKEENTKLDENVERVLQMALLEKGNLNVEMKPVDLVMIINKSIKSNQLKASSIHADIIFKTDLDFAFIIGDEFGLLNVFNNLIDNSLKYSKIPCRISVELSRENNFFKVKLKDNGIGMEEKELKTIFDKFYRIQRGNLHDVKGSGLGLSYVRSIIHIHKGTIDVDSKLGIGSEFTIKLMVYES